MLEILNYFQKESGMRSLLDVDLGQLVSKLTYLSSTNFTNLSFQKIKIRNNGQSIKYRELFGKSIGTTELEKMNWYSRENMCILTYHMV